MSINKAQTGFRSLTYRSGAVYNWCLQNLFDQRKKFAIIANIIGKNQLVLDLPCGTGYLARYLHPSNEYFGIDLNHRFLKRVKKDWRRGRISVKKVILQQSNIFNYDDYLNGDIDTIVLCDILHHVIPKHIELVETAKKHARKVIICEPIAVKPHDVYARTWFFRLWTKFGKLLPEKLFKFFDKLFLDNDGLNSYKRRSLWEHTRESLKKFYESLEFNIIYNLSDGLIGVWHGR